MNVTAMLRALGCAALFLALCGHALAGTVVRSVNGVEVIVFERDTAPFASTPKRRLAPGSAHAFRPAADTRRVNVVAPSAPQLHGASDLIATALGFVGTPYVWGGAAPGGFDCSGFTYYAFARLGIRIPRTADLQFAAGRLVAGDPLPGDLVFFQTYDYGASHVGIYLGNGRFVNSIGDSVHVATFGSTYFRSRYIGARRFLST